MQGPPDGEPAMQDPAQESASEQAFKQGDE